MLQRFSLGLFFGALLGPMASLPLRGATLTDGIAAVVNDDIITFSDVKKIEGRTEETLLAMYEGHELEDKIRETRKEALDQLIERRLIIQQFNHRGGKVPDSYVDDDIQGIIDDQFDRDRSRFIKTLEARGIDLETYREEKRNEIIVHYMQNTEVTNEIIISPFKIENYYKEHPDEFKEGERVKLRLIYIKKGPDKNSAENARSLAQDLLVKLSVGSDFTSLASVYSEDKSTKNEKGEMGFVTREDLRPELAETAFALKPGQVSKVIESSDGFYIIQVEDKKPNEVKGLEEARSLIERLLTSQERNRLQKLWLDSLRRKAYIRMY